MPSADATGRAAEPELLLVASTESARLTPCTSSTTSGEARLRRLPLCLSRIGLQDELLLQTSIDAASGLRTPSGARYINSPSPTAISGRRRAPTPWLPSRIGRPAQPAGSPPHVAQTSDIQAVKRGFCVRVLGVEATHKTAGLVSPTMVSWDGDRYARG